MESEKTKRKRQNKAGEFGKMDNLDFLELQKTVTVAAYDVAVKIVKDSQLDLQDSTFNFREI